MPNFRVSRNLTSTFYLFFALSFSLLMLTLSAVGEDRDSELPQKLSAANPEFQVNSYTLSSQRAPSVAAYADGFVAVWQSIGSFFDDTDGNSIQGRLFDSLGRPVSSEFQVNTYTSGSQTRPRLAASSDGRFVVVWRGGSGIRARLFESAGAPVGDDFEVGTSTSYINAPAVAVRDDSFLVVWTGGETLDKTIMARLFASDGTPSAAAFEVNSYTTNAQASPDVALSPAGDFVVVWHSYGSFGDDNEYGSIQMRNLGSGGTLVGTETQVNSWTTGDAFEAAIGFAADGTFAVTWTTYPDSGPGTDLDPGSAMRRFDSAGNGLGGDFQVNTYEAGPQYAYEVRSTTDGGFVVVWNGQATGSADSDGYAVGLRRYDSAGASVGSDFVINTLTTGEQYGPRLAMNGLGDVLVVWESDASDGGDTSFSSVQARFFAAESDIAVTVDNGVGSVTPGAQVVYTVEVSNAGPDLGTGVGLIDTLPTELICDWTSAASGGATGNTLSGSGDLAETLTLPSGAGVVYTLDCLVASDATGGLLHSAEASVEQVDTDSANNAAFDLDGLVRSTDLDLGLSVSSPNVVSGDEIEITATIRQSGPSDSSGGMVFDALPAELEFLDSADCVELAGFLECQIPPLTVGETATATYRVRVAAGLSPGASIDNEAVTVADDDDPNTANDVDGFTLYVVDPLFRDGFESGNTSAWSSSLP